MADGATIARKAKSHSLSAFADACPYCDRLGLPILPLRYAYQPADNVPQGKGIAGSATSKLAAPLSGGSYVPRILSDGYVYLYDERKSEGWRCFAVTSNGYLREYPVAQRPTGEVTFQCSRAGDSLVAGLINIRKARDAGRVWIAYSSTWWTETVRNHHATNPSGRMQPLDVPQLLAGTLPEYAFKVEADGAPLEARVPEYAGETHLFTGSTVQGIDRKGQAAKQGKCMDDTMPGKGLAVILSDPVGIAQEIRHHANAANGKLALLRKQHERELWNSHAIEQLEKMFEKGGKVVEWAEDYRSKLDMGKLQRFRSSYERQELPLIATRDDICGDYTRWMKSDIFKLARDKDFDHDDGASCCHFVQQMGAVLKGAGLNYNERKFALETLQNADDDNLWLRTLTGNQKSLQAYIAKDKTDSLNDMGKNLYSAIDEWNKTNAEVAKELGIHVGERLTPAQLAASDKAMQDAFFRCTLRGKQAVQDAVQTTLHNMQSFVTDIKLAGLRQLRIGLFVGYLWVRTRFVPAVVETTVSQELRRQKEAVWGGALATRLESASIENGKRYRMNVGDVTDELGDAGRTRIRKIVVNWKASFKIEAGTTQQAMLGELHEQRWLLPSSSAGKAIAAADPAVAQLPQVNPAQVADTDGLKFLKAGGANALFCAVAGYFQIAAIGEAEKAMHGAKGGLASLDAQAKLSSAYMGVAGAIMEGTFALLPAVEGLGAIPKGLSDVGVMRFMLGNSLRLASVGAAVGGLGGVVSGVATYMDGSQLIGQGETTAGWLTRGGGAALFLSGGLSVAGASIGIFNLTGGVLLGIGPGGWAVLAIGATAIALVLLFEGEQARSNTYQNWLRKAWFGKDNGNAEVGYRSEKQEAEAFGDLFKLPLQVRFQWREGLAGGNVNVEINAPVLTDSWMRYDIAFVVGGKSLKAGEVRKLGDALPSYASVAGQAFHAQELGMRPAFEPHAAGATWHLSWLDDRPITSAAVVLEYWPDKHDNPDIILPHAGGSTFKSTPKDAEAKA